MPTRFYDNFKISETGEALLDLDDLLRVQLNNDNVQGFDRHQVRRRYIKDVYKKQLHFSGLKRLTTLYLHDTVRKREVASYSRLKDMVRRSRDNGLSARNEDRSLPGATASKAPEKKIPKAMRRKR